MNDIEIEVLYDYLKQSNSFLEDISEYSFDILSASTDISKSAKFIKDAIAGVDAKTQNVDAKTIQQNIQAETANTVNSQQSMNIGSYTEADIAKLSKIITIYAKSINKSVGTLPKDTKKLSESIKAVDVGFISALGKMKMKDAESMVKNFFNVLESFVKHLNKFKIKKEISSRAKKSIGYVRSTINEVSNVMKGINFEGLDGFGHSLLKVARSITGFVGALAIGGALSIIATPGLLFFKLALRVLQPEFKSLAKDNKKLKDGAQSVMYIGAGILAMSLAIAASAYAISKFSITDMVVGMVTVIGVTYIVAKFYKYMGLSDKSDLKNGIKNMVLMSLSLLMMTGTFWVISKLPIDYKQVGLTVLLLAGTAALFALIGMKTVSDKVKEGALAIGFVSLSLLLFGFSVCITAKMLAGQTNAIWQIPLMLFAVTAPFVAAGFLLPKIAMGALAFALIGISLWIMKKPLTEIGNMIAKNGGLIWKIPTFITALGLVYAGAGLLIAPISLGALAVGLLAGSLYVLAKALKPISELNLEREQMSIFADSLGIVVKGVSDAFSNLSIGSFLKITMMGNKVGEVVGVFARSLSYWKATTTDWKPEDAKTLADTILGVTTAVALGTSPEYIKKMHGIDVSQWQILKGIAFTMSLGSNLKKLADGVLVWKNMKLSPDDARNISDNINTILSVIPATIARIGNDDITKPATGLLGFITGGAWTTTNTERGIDYVKGIGKAMTKLADGVKMWKEMKLTPNDAKLISDNVNTVLSIIPSTISKIGNDNTIKSSGLFGIWKTTDTERGIDYVKGIGRSLYDLGEGVKTWKSMKLTPTETKLISDNINAVLSIIPSTIAKIGDDTKTSKPGLFGMWKTTDTERGIKYVNGLGAPLKDLSIAVLNWKQAKLTPADIKLIEKNITELITTIPSAFAAVGRAKNNDKGFWGMFKSDAEKGIRVVNNMMSPLKSLSDVVSSFSGTTDIKDRGKQIGEGVKQLLVGSAIGMSLLTTDKVDIFNKFIDPFKRFADIYIKFLKDLKNESAGIGDLSKIIDSSANFYDKYSAANIKSSASYNSVYNYSQTSQQQAAKLVVQAPHKPLTKEDKYAQMMLLFTEATSQQQQQTNLLFREIQKLNSKIEGLVGHDGRMKVGLSNN